MLIVLLVALIALNLVDVAVAAFILADFASLNVYSFAGIEILMLLLGFVIIAAAIVIQIATDKAREIHIPEFSNCITLSAVGVHIAAHILPAIAAVRYAWYSTTLPDSFLTSYGILTGCSAVGAISAIVAIYAVLEIHAVQKILSSHLQATRKALNLKAIKEIDL